MLWRDNSIIVGLMAARTLGRGILILPVGMALIACDSQVCPCERELGLIMVECRRLPGCGIVTGLTVRRESCSQVIWIRRTVKLLLVAAYAGHRRPGIDAIHVARYTGCGHMCTCEREFRGTVIET